MARSVRNPGASVRARLLILARERNQPFDLLLTRYVLERLLDRLSRTRYRDRFVLKGAMLMATWFADPHRPTRDLDLLGFGDPDPGVVLAVFRDVCAVPAEDGVAFNLDSVSIDRIREDAVYGGLRLKMAAAVGGARVRVVVTSASATRSSRGSRIWRCRCCWICRLPGCGPTPARLSSRRSSRPSWRSVGRTLG